MKGGGDGLNSQSAAARGLSEVRTVGGVERVGEKEREAFHLAHGNN